MIIANSKVSNTSGRRRPAITPWRQALRPESLLISALLALAISSPLLYRQQNSSVVEYSPAAVRPSTFRRSEGFKQVVSEIELATPVRALVIYVYSGSDPEYEANLQFFIREAIKVRFLQFGQSSTCL